MAKGYEKLGIGLVKVAKIVADRIAISLGTAEKLRLLEIKVDEANRKQL